MNSFENFFLNSRALFYRALFLLFCNFLFSSILPNINSKCIWVPKDHLLDSSSVDLVIDFINENDKTLVDIGSGAGFPGIALGIIIKERKIPLDIKLIEKSSKKIKFLEETIKELNLNINVSNENVFTNKSMFSDEVFITRAFKPISVILELIHKKAKNFKKIIIFLGKTGKKELLEASKSWDIKYKQRMSLTSSDSIIIQIDNLKKK